MFTNRWPDGVAESELLDGVQVTRLEFPLPAARPAQAIRFLAAAPSAARAMRHATSATGRLTSFT